MLLKQSIYNLGTKVEGGDVKRPQWLRCQQLENLHEPKKKKKGNGLQPTETHLNLAPETQQEY